MVKVRTPLRARMGAPGIGVFVVLAAVLVVTACSGEADDGSGDDSGDDGDQGVAITWIETERRTVEIAQSALGTVRTVKEPQISAEVAARIDELAVDEGDTVAAGDRLARLDAEDYRIERDRAEAEIARLGARIRVQEATVARNEALQGGDFVSAQAFEESVAELDALRQERSAARQGLRAAERDLERTDIRAPFAGSIDERMVSEGDFVQRGAVLYRLTTDEVLEVRAGFPETLAPILERGMPVEVHNRSAETSQLDTEITELRPTITESGRMLEVIATVDNPGGWRAGASVDLDVVTAVRDSVTVPPQALVRRPDGDTVYVLDDDRETVSARVVEVGHRTAERVEISAGLDPGEAIAVDGAGFLADGATVTASQDEE